MPAAFDAESTLTDRYQATTVPEDVRRTLRLGKRDKVHYVIRPDGEVVLTRVERNERADPALGAFLSFLECDITVCPPRACRQWTPGSCKASSLW